MCSPVPEQKGKILFLGSGWRTFLAFKLQKNPTFPSPKQPGQPQMSFKLSIIEADLFPAAQTEFGAFCCSKIPFLYSVQTPWLLPRGSAMLSVTFLGDLLNLRRTEIFSPGFNLYFLGCSVHSSGQKETTNLSQELWCHHVWKEIILGTTGRKKSGNVAVKCRNSVQGAPPRGVLFLFVHLAPPAFNTSSNW